MDTINKPLDHVQLKKIFIHQLNRIYFGKCYLNQTLQSLIKTASFKNLQLAIQEMGDDVKKQINRMEDIYTLLNEKPYDQSRNPIKSIIKDDFYLNHIQQMPVLKDMDIILYVQLLEHINITTYRMLKMLASELKNAEIDQLLIECFDESVDDDQLFVLIAQEYLTPENYKK